MGSNRKGFATLLTNALRLIKANEDKNIGVIEDELAFAIGKENGGESTVRFWRRGHIPADPIDVYHLAQEIVARKGFDLSKCEQFLKYADYPNPADVARIICQAPKAPDKFSDTALNSLDSLWAPPTRPLNHFVVGPPIENPAQFYGRQRHLKQIFGTLNRSPLQHFAIIGRRRSGKSSLLKHLRNVCFASEILRPDQTDQWLDAPEQYRWVMVDFQDPRNHTIPRLLGSILSQVGVNPPANCTLDLFMDHFIPVLDRPTVILMDEIVTALTAPDLPVQLWWGFRSLANSYAKDNLAFIITSHQDPMACAEEKGKSSPFFNIFKHMSLGPWEGEVVSEYLFDAPVDISPEEMTWITKRSGRWPILVQLLTQLLSIHKQDNRMESFKEMAELQLTPFEHLINP